MRFKRPRGLLPQLVSPWKRARTVSRTAVRMTGPSEILLGRPLFY